MKIKNYIFILLLPFTQGCGVYKGAQEFANMRKTSLFLAKENRLLKKEVTSLKFKVNELKNKNEFLTLSNENNQ